VLPVAFAAALRCGSGLIPLCWACKAACWARAALAVNAATGLACKAAFAVGVVALGDDAFGVVGSGGGGRAGGAAFGSSTFGSAGGSTLWASAGSNHTALDSTEGSAQTDLVGACLALLDLAVLDDVDATAGGLAAGTGGGGGRTPFDDWLDDDAAGNGAGATGGGLGTTGAAGWGVATPTGGCFGTTGGGGLGTTATPAAEAERSEAVGFSAADSLGGGSDFLGLFASDTVGFALAPLLALLAAFEFGASSSLPESAARPENAVFEK